MIHRYVAGILGCLILFNFFMHIKHRSILHTTLFAAVFLLVLVIFQALLGMWTVTLRLYPVVVLAHLLGGMAILAMLWWQKLSLEKLVTPQIKQYYYTSNKLINVVCNISILVIIIQLGLGAWTSSNYAAIVCADFPTCQGKLWPVMDFKSAFALFNVGIFDSPGTPLENTARVTIQMTHRIGALISFIFLSYLSWILFTLKYNPSARRLAMILFFVLCVQIILGITNILAALPMPVALLHNVGGAVLLLTLIKIKNAKIIS
jgi:heme a synthase